MRLTAPTPCDVIKSNTYIQQHIGVRPQLFNFFDLMKLKIFFKMVKKLKMMKC